MTWRVAKSLDVLLAQINALSPNRSKDSDGSIGDASHSARQSDHNPDDNGVVHARDFTNDPAHGIVSEQIAQALVASKDRRIKYIISNRKIAAGAAGPNAWEWRPYGGINPHDHHCHVSVVYSALADSTSPWDLSALGAGPPPDVVNVPPVATPPILRRGIQDTATSGPVHEAQTLINKHRESPIPVDGDFGPTTETAVRAFQRGASLLADGVIGGYTWRALKA